jgi:hypothetical protein
MAGISVSGSILLRPSTAADALGDVLGIVADPLDHARNLERGDHFAQVVGHRRAQRDDPHGQPVDLGFQRVDPRSSLATTRASFARHGWTKRVDRVADRHFGQPAHLARSARASWLISFVECLDGMFGHDRFLSRSGR